MSARDDLNALLEFGALAAFVCALWLLAFAVLPAEVW